MPAPLFAEIEFEVQWIIAFAAVALLLAGAGYVFFRYLLPEPDSDLTISDTPGYRKLEQLVGQVGKTVTPLCPSGVTLIQGERVYVTSGGPYVETGRWVRVTDIRVGLVYVRVLTETELQNSWDLKE